MMRPHVVHAAGQGNLPDDLPNWIVPTLFVRVGLNESFMLVTDFFPPYQSRIGIVVTKKFGILEPLRS